MQLLRIQQANPLAAAANAHVQLKVKVCADFWQWCDHPLAKPIFYLHHMCIPGKATASTTAAANPKINALMMAIKKIEHVHGKGKTSPFHQHLKRSTYSFGPHVDVIIPFPCISGSLMRFGDKNAQLPSVEVISTGSMALDHALGN